MNRTGFAELRPTYQSWQAMLHRCYNPTNRQYKDYGGRGILVCEEWLNSFYAFLQDMGKRPEGMQLDRLDNDVHYYPWNCKWSTKKEQMRNRRDSVFLTFNGQTRTLAEWAEVTGIPHMTVLKRWNRGWSVERTLSKGVNETRGQFIEFRGQSLNISQWAELCGVKPNTLWQELYRRKLSLEDAIGARLPKLPIARRPIRLP